MIDKNKQFATRCPRATGPWRIRVVGVAVFILLTSNGFSEPWRFDDVTLTQNCLLTHEYTNVNELSDYTMSGGVAAADYDLDGDIDLYVITGDSSPNALLNNDGTGKFNDRAPSAGVGLPGAAGSGPAFGDITGDGWPDLLVGGVSGSGYKVFRNNGNGSFTDWTEASGIVQETALQNDYSSALGDPDRDGDLDLFVTHWGAGAITNHLWINDGAGHFTKGDGNSGITGYVSTDFSFSPTFVDLNGDGWQDLTVAGDFKTSQIYMNQGDGTFTNSTSSVIDDENGMGSAVADLDNDGDMDWFVTSIFADGPIPFSWGPSGNRLYQNDGSGNFTNITESSGVREGHWGWGACAADFNNDGWLDLFHVNGMPLKNPTVDFNVDPSRLFINNGDGSFVEMSEALGLIDQGQGRGVSCFDADLDGDLDIFVANYDGETRLYRNNMDGGANYLQVRLIASSGNSSAIGAKLTLRAGDLTQYREVTAGSNYVSQNPLVQHFGLAASSTADLLTITWPDGSVERFENLPANQLLVVNQTATPWQPGVTHPVVVLPAWALRDVSRQDAFAGTSHIKRFGLNPIQYHKNKPPKK